MKLKKLSEEELAAIEKLRALCAPSVTIKEGEDSPAGLSQWALRLVFQQVDAQAAEIEALKALVGEMARTPPIAWTSTSTGAEYTCLWCGKVASRTDDAQHTPDCPITRGQELGVLPKE